MKYGYLRIIKPEWLGRWSNGINLPCWSKVTNIELVWQGCGRRITMLYHVRQSFGQVGVLTKNQSQYGGGGGKHLVYKYVNQLYL